MYCCSWQVVKDEYEEKGAVLGLHQPVSFEADIITLGIPRSGITIKGWEITPLISPVVSSCGCPMYVIMVTSSPLITILYIPQVTKKQVDNFREGKLTPCCQLKAHLSGNRKKIPYLSHQVVLQGAKQPYNFFTLELPVQGTMVVHVSVVTTDC